MTASPLDRAIEALSEIAELADAIDRADDVWPDGTTLHIKLRFARHCREVRAELIEAKKQEGRPDAETLAQRHALTIMRQQAALREAEKARKRLIAAQPLIGDGQTELIAIIIGAINSLASVTAALADQNGEMGAK